MFLICSVHIPYHKRSAPYLHGPKGTLTLGWWVPLQTNTSVIRGVEITLIYVVVDSGGLATKVIQDKAMCNLLMYQGNMPSVRIFMPNI